MKDAKHKIIYVGKAKNLKNRVRSYFQKRTDDRLYTDYLVRRIVDIDFVLTATEKEALILENNLIKQFKPKFNINLRDDKAFICIKLEVQKEFLTQRSCGRLKTTTPFTSGPYVLRAVRETLRYLNETFPIRKCRDSAFKNRVKPCLYYQMQKCLAPCCGLVDKSTYQGMIDQVILVLKGKQEDLVDVLRKRMYEESGTMRYEKGG